MDRLRLGIILENKKNEVNKIANAIFFSKLIELKKKIKNINRMFVNQMKIRFKGQLTSKCLFVISTKRKTMKLL